MPEYEDTQAEAILRIVPISVPTGTLTDPLILMYGLTGAGGGVGVLGEDGVVLPPFPLVEPDPDVLLFPDVDVPLFVPDEFEVLL